MLLGRSWVRASVATCGGRSPVVPLSRIETKSAPARSIDCAPVGDGALGAAASEVAALMLELAIEPPRASSPQERGGGLLPRGKFHHMEPMFHDSSV